jgi:hypothetical protein
MMLKSNQATELEAGISVNRDKALTAKKVLAFLADLLSFVDGR